MVLDINKKISSIDGWVASNKITNFITSYVSLGFFYGIFLFLYELKFIRELIPIIHPILIFWAAFVGVYNVVFRKCFTKWPHWMPLLLFGVSVGITSVANYEVGIVQNIKVCILVLLPLVAFYPVCLVEDRKIREHNLIKVMIGASVVVFFSSVAALIMYMIRFGQNVSFMGIESIVGIRLYDPNDYSSGVVLYGLYEDTNHAAVYAIIFAIHSVLLYRACGEMMFSHKWKNNIGRIFSIANFIVQVCYFPLANSRGAWLCGGIAGFVALLVFFYRNKSTRSDVRIKILVSVTFASLTVVAIMVGLLFLRTGEAALSGILKNKSILQETIVDDAFTEDIQINQLTEVVESIETGQSLEVVGTQEVESQIEVVENIETEQSLEALENLEGESSTEVVESIEIEQSIESGQEDNVDNVVKQKNEIYVDTFVKKNAEFGAGRLQIWKEVPELLMKKPVLGTGFGNHQYYAQKYNVGQEKLAKGAALHNGYLDLLLSYGVVGFCIFITFWGLCLRTVLVYIIGTKEKISALYLCVSFVVLLIAGEAMLLSNLFINTTAMYYVMLIMTGYLMSETDFNK